MTLGIDLKLEAIARRTFSGVNYALGVQVRSKRFMGRSVPCHLLEVHNRRVRGLEQTARRMGRRL